MERAEVVVVGAGLIGSTIAWRLARAGRKVVLLDRGEPGAEASAAAAGLLIPQAGGIASPLFELYRAGLDCYPDYVEEISATSGVPVEYRACGHLLLALDAGEEADLAARVPLQRAANFPVEWITADEARRMEAAINPSVRAALCFARHALVDSRRLSAAVPIAAARVGADVRPYVAALCLETTSGRTSGVETTQGRIAADVVINAAGCWASRLAPWMSRAVTAAKGEMVAVRAWRRPVERIVSVSTGSVSTRADGRVFLGATRTNDDFSNDVRAVAIRRMLDVAERAVPGLENAPFVEAWTGLRPLSADGLPIIGADQRSGLYWATGHLGMGIVSAPATAEAIQGLIDGEASKISLDDFAPGRFEAQ